MRAFPGNTAIYCRKCEEPLGKPKKVPQVKYCTIPTKFGALVRRCSGCGQLWLGYMRKLPSGGHKIIMKMIDKEL